jgi:hypothetical protein
VALALAKNRSPDSYLAGGAAMHLAPRSTRYSNDLDYFNDSVERVATAFSADSETLRPLGIEVQAQVLQPGFVRAIVSREDVSTKVEWVHDSSWRFLPVVKCPRTGYRLSSLDLAINKVLALVGRNEPRDFLDTLEVQREVLPLGALIWAAAGKDPGYTPLLLLELLKRRGRFQPEEFQRLHLVRPPNLLELRAEWSAALESAQAFIDTRPSEEMGALYYDTATCRFVAPSADAPDSVVCHFGAPGGVIPRVILE